MRKKILSVLLFISVSVFAFSSVLPAYAHGGEPRLEISLDRINPGGTLEVRGVEFDYDEPVTLSLMRAEIQIPLMDVIADPEGVFTQVIVLPADLPPGEYTFRAKSEHHKVLSPVFMVSGPALLDKEDNGVRDQSDLELGPLPTFVPEGIPEKVPQAAAAEASIPKTSPMTLIVSLIVGTLLLAFLSLRLFRKQRA